MHSPLAAKCAIVTMATTAVATKLLPVAIATHCSLATQENVTDHVSLARIAVTIDDSTVSCFPANRDRETYVTREVGFRALEHAVCTTAPANVDMLG